jgi:hypothetical protein
VDDLALESFLLGACGWVAGLVVAFPRETVRIWELAEAGRWQEARAIYEWFLPLLHLDIGPKFVQQIKLVEALMGVGSARVRGPRLALSDQEASRVSCSSTRLATRPPSEPRGLNFRSKSGYGGPSETNSQPGRKGLYPAGRKLVMLAGAGFAGV